MKYFPDNKYSFFSRDEEPEDVNIIHYPYFEPFFLTLPFKSKKKFVVTVHDLTPLAFPKNFPAGVKGKIKWNLQKMRLKKASAIITDSKSSKKDIVRFVGVDNNKVSVVYLAAGEQFEIIKDRNNLDNIKDKFSLPDKFVLYVGDVTWNKNLPRLIEAAKIANVKLVMVGKALVEKDYDKTNPWNQDRSKIAEMIKGNKKVKLLGFLPDEDLIALYNTATVFAMPSLYEGFGLPILEAMKCGCPVVTSKKGSLPEIAGDAVLYVDAYNAEDIAKGLEKVLKDSSLAKSLSEKGALQAKKFSWKKTAKETMEVYESVSRSTSSS